MKHIPKADMHVHLEGTLMPEMARKIAARNNLPLPEGLFTKDGKSYTWHDDGTAAGALLGFLHTYDKATQVLKAPKDYTDITYGYLKRSADEGCIYAEIGISADHGAACGIPYREMVEAIAKGYEKAKAETGIEVRLISTCVRHYDPAAALHVGRITRDNPHPLVTAFGIAGDENAYTPADFKEAFDISGLLNRTAHAGEAAGVKSIRAVRDVLGVKRFGHMVRAIDDQKLMEELRDIGAVPEVCVSSNLVLKVFKDYAAHPLRKFFDFGLKVVLGSDDPSFFHTSIGREYDIAQQHFGFTDAELRQVTRNAIEAAFVDEKTREYLFRKL